MQSGLGDDMQVIERVPRGLLRVCVTVDREYNNLKQLQAAGGSVVEIEIDPGYNPTHHVREFGTVAARPLLNGEPFEQATGVPNEVREGDRVYFHYHAITEEYRYVVDGRTFYLLPYDLLYCAVREGQIIPLGNFLLCEPVVESRGEIKTASGLVLNPHNEERRSTQVATVAHVPLTPRPLLAGIGPGTRVCFVADADLPLTVEGTAYFIMQADDLVATQLPQL